MPTLVALTPVIPEPSPINIPAKVVAATVPSTVNALTPVTTPASTFTAPSNTIADPSAGVILIAPVLVVIVTTLSPAAISSDLIKLAETPVIPEPSPVNDSAVITPEDVILRSPVMSRSSLATSAFPAEV